MRLLIVEDSAVLRESLQDGLRHAGFAVDAAADGTDGLYLARTHSYDLIVLDIMLPGIDGRRLLRTIRDGKCQTPVLLLTAKDQLQDKVGGLRAGADDYLVKPFAFDELLARIEAIIRRRDGRVDSSVEVGALRLDPVARTVTLAGKPVDLAPREFHLLQYLMIRRGQIVSRTEIEENLYDRNATLMSNVVDTVIYALRKKIALPDQEPMIRTRRGLGYVLEEPL
jgi:two-component system copper resistance phosphate regulon response regulator CusR